MKMEITPYLSIEAAAAVLVIAASNFFELIRSIIISFMALCVLCAAKILDLLRAECMGQAPQKETSNSKEIYDSFYLEQQAGVAEGRNTKTKNMQVTEKKRNKPIWSWEGGVDNYTKPSVVQCAMTCGLLDLSALWPELPA